MSDASGQSVEALRAGGDCHLAGAGGSSAGGEGEEQNSIKNLITGMKK